MPSEEAYRKRHHVSCSDASSLVRSPSSAIFFNWYIQRSTKYVQDWKILIKYIQRSTKYVVDCPPVRM